MTQIFVAGVSGGITIAGLFRIGFDLTSAGMFGCAVATALFSVIIAIHRAADKQE